MSMTFTLTIDGYEAELDGGPPLHYVATPPPAANSPGTKNQVSYDEDFFYICIATDTWRRVEILTW